MKKTKIIAIVTIFILAGVFFVSSHLFLFPATADGSLPRPTKEFVKIKTQKRQIIDLNIKGVKTTSQYSDVIKKLGDPKSRKKGDTFPCNYREEDLRLNYSGMDITLIKTNDDEDFIVGEIEVKSPKWFVAPKIRFDNSDKWRVLSNIKIGDTKKEIQKKIGKGKAYTASGIEYLAYPMLEGSAELSFRRNKLESIYWQFNIC